MHLILIGYLVVLYCIVLVIFFFFNRVQIKIELVYGISGVKVGLRSTIAPSLGIEKNSFARDQGLVCKIV